MNSEVSRVLLGPVLDRRHARDRNLSALAGIHRAMGLPHLAHDCQVDCQAFELALFSSDHIGRLQAAELLIWTPMDQPGQTGKS
jgi:hypothetical protein